MTDYDQVLPLTPEGAERLAEIVSEVRYSSGMKQGEFQRLINISHTTISNIENKKLNSIRLSTLIKLCSHTKYTEAELISICTGGKAVLAGQDRIYRTAEDAWSILEQMPTSEVALLIERALADLELPRSQIFDILRLIVEILDN